MSDTENDLIGATPAALNWVEEARRRCPPGFADARGAVIWTDLPTDEGELLGGTAEEVLAHFRGGLPWLLKHDPLRPIGWGTEAELFTAPDGTRFVAVVMWRFASDGPPLSEPSNPAPVRLHPADVESAGFAIVVHHREMPHEPFEESLRSAPDRVHPHVVPAYRHSADSSVWQLTVEVAYGALVALGIAAAPGVIGAVAKAEIVDAWRWVKQAGVDRFCELAGRYPLLDVESSYRGCSIQLVVKSSDASVLRQALETAPACAIRAGKLIESYHRDDGVGLRVVVYHFTPAGHWEPHHAYGEDGTLYRGASELVPREMPAESGVSLGGRGARS